MNFSKVIPGSSDRLAITLLVFACLALGLSLQVIGALEHLLTTIEWDLVPSRLRRTPKPKPSEETVSSSMATVSPIRATPLTVVSSSDPTPDTSSQQAPTNLSE